MLRRLFDIVLIIALVACAYYYRTPLLAVAGQVTQRVTPCAQPVTYTIGTIDPRFNITRDAFLKDAQKAADIWNKGANRSLLAYDETNGAVKINFVYDDRKKTTQQLNAINASIDTNQSSYTASKSQYDALIQDYNAKKAAFAALQSQYSTALATYNAEVAKWNSRGGAPVSVVAELNAQRSELEVLSRKEQFALATVNEAARASNGAALSLNSVANTYNADAANYNAISQTLGGEFEEGVFVSTGWEEHIDVYQYKDTHTLVRLLAHEMGHSLGLGHVENPAAIMYYLNDSTLERLTPDDLSAIDAKCGSGINSLII